MTDYNEVEPKVIEVKEEDIVEVTEERPKKLNQIAKTAKPRKRGLVERAVAALVGPEGIRAVGRTLNQEIVVPSIKNIVVESIKTGVDIFVYGDEGRGGRRSNGYRQGSYQGGYSSSRRGGTNYSQSYKDANAGRDGTYSRERAKGNQVPTYIIGTRQEATDVLDALCEIVEEYGSATLSDYYDLIGVDAEFTDESVGWSDLRQARVRAERGGFTIMFPRLVKLGGGR